MRDSSTYKSQTGKKICVLVSSVKNTSTIVNIFIKYVLDITVDNRGYSDSSIHSYGRNLK